VCRRHDEVALANEREGTDHADEGDGGARVADFLAAQKFI